METLSKYSVHLHPPNPAEDDGSMTTFDYECVRMWDEKYDINMWINM